VLAVSGGVLTAAAAAAAAAAAEQIAVEGDCSDMLVCLQGLHLVQLPPVDLSIHCNNTLLLHTTPR
jgi:hypothetical protein